uniref:Sulfhydryl oxidase n=1 Tax=Haptolina brevifila TaxID=156173 RepID=A0A7S2IFU1_9EUKA
MEPALQGGCKSMQQVAVAAKRPRKSRKSVEVWGPAAWTWLHSVAFDYALMPTSYDRQQALTFLKSYANAIPCPSCRRHFNAVTADDLARGVESDILASRDAYSRATVRWHNSINQNLGKPMMSYDAVAREFEDSEVLIDDDCMSRVTGSSPADPFPADPSTRHLALLGTSSPSVSPESSRPTTLRRLLPSSPLRAVAQPPSTQSLSAMILD